MIQRRHFLYTPGLLFLPAASAATRPAPGESAAGLVVVDRRWPEAAALLAAARRSGGRVFETDGDITGVWQDLDGLWRNGGPAVIEGITTHQALFCLEQLALDHRRHVVRRQAFSAGQVRWRIEPRGSQPKAAGRSLFWNFQA